MPENDPVTSSSYDILKRFIITGLHPIASRRREEWPHETTVVCLIEYLDNSQEIVVKDNVPRSRHAEGELVETIKKKQDITKINRITIYSNYSSCIKCSRELKELKEDHPKWQIKLKFSAFYFIRRDSCTGYCGCRTKERQAFGMLMELDARPFQKEDWDALIKLLKENGKQKENDEQKKNDTSDLDELRYGDTYKDWRNGEDEKMKADYEMLRAQISPSTPKKNTSSAGEPAGPSKGDQARGSTGAGKSRRELGY